MMHMQIIVPIQFYNIFIFVDLKWSCWIVIILLLPTKWKMKVSHMYKHLHT
jgi:hypothetical protein